MERSNFSKGAVKIGFDTCFLINLYRNKVDIDNSVYKIHVNEEKNDIADWIGREIDAELGKKVKEVKTKQEIIVAIQNFGKEVKKEGKEGKVEKKDEKTN